MYEHDTQVSAIHGELGIFCPATAVCLHLFNPYNAELFSINYGHQKIFSI